MSRRQMGVALVAVGVLLVLSGIIAAIDGSGDEGDTTEPSTATEVRATPPPDTTATIATTESATTASDTTIAVATTAASPATVSPSTIPLSTISPSTISVPSTIPPSAVPATDPATTATPAPSVEEFVVAYAAAIEAGDGDLLFSSLLPEIVDSLGDDLCREWIEREILELRDYRLNGDIGDPAALTLVLGDVSIDVDQHVEVPVSFAFQGQTFDSIAAFAVVDDRVHWIGACR